MNVLWEAMIADMRAERADLDSRRHFTPEKEPIQDSRTFIRDLITASTPEDPDVVVAHSAASFRAAAEDVEMG